MTMLPLQISGCLIHKRLWLPMLIALFAAAISPALTADDRKESGKEIIGCDLNEVGNNDWDANVGARMLYQLCCII